jgi:orotidine-5'-phosphate decarboxylase
MPQQTELIVALDVATENDALELVDQTGDAVTWYKVGKQLFTSCGPSVIKQLKDRNKRVFLDLKFHDIPNTVASAIRSASDLGVDMTNVHASGGPAMLTAAAEAAKANSLLLIAVTVLTSMDQNELSAIGIQDDMTDQVLRLAKLTAECNLDGVVCSPWEISVIRDSLGSNFKLVTPGIRPASVQKDDQKRVMTPAEAADAGADFIVVGRPISKAEDPFSAAKAVRSELEH